MIETFWRWAFKSHAGRKTGFSLIISRWLVLDILISIFLTLYLNEDGFIFASKSLYPAASILVGMSIAWTSRASIILNDVEFRKSVMELNNPIEDYVYGYQISILIIIITVVYISIMAAGGINIGVFGFIIDEKISTFFLFMLLSLSIRECWGVINFSNLLALLADRVKQPTTRED
mgnify:CR=1 FL=1